jgi:hypothetical protein
VCCLDCGQTHLVNFKTGKTISEQSTSRRRVSSRGSGDLRRYRHSYLHVT